TPGTSEATGPRSLRARLRETPLDHVQGRRKSVAGGAERDSRQRCRSSDRLNISAAHFCVARESYIDEIRVRRLRASGAFSPHLPKPIVLSSEPHVRVERVPNPPGNE